LAGLIFFWRFSDNVISERTNVVYKFGPFRLEVGEHRLVREGRSVPLTGKAFETLRVLVERHGSVVSKRDLMNAVWPETTVEENNLDRNISALRKALGEKTTGRQYIETVPRVGYRFIASLSETPREDLAGSVLRAPDLSAIAVLPFADMSPSRDQDYLCEGPSLKPPSRSIHIFSTPSTTLPAPVLPAETYNVRQNSFAEPGSFVWRTFKAPCFFLSLSGCSDAWRRQS
jgi:DNA-binding winged helix-turn-helix (wHTH) protein